MPVTAKFSKEFYDKLGHPVADEIVDWFNQVDATYRTDLRELNELNFARFDAKLEQRLAGQDAKWEQRIAAQDAKWEKRVAAVRTEIHQAMSHLEVRLIRWMVGLWIAGLGTSITLLKLWTG
jgi:hypothetical protein